MGEFGPESVDQRKRRAFAHAKIARYKSGEGSFSDAMKAAHAASHTRKGRDSRFGSALGSIRIVSDTQYLIADKLILSGFSPRRQEEVDTIVKAGQPYDGDVHTQDIHLARSGAKDGVPKKLPAVIDDPLQAIEQGFEPRATRNGL